MYAILKTGGKQYKVRPGDIIQVEKLNIDPGKKIDFTDVLFLSENSHSKSSSKSKKVTAKKSHIGHPMVSGAKIKALVLKQGKEKKILVFKKRRRKSYRKTQGHRQNYSEILIESIQTPEGEVYKN